MYSSVFVVWCALLLVVACATKNLLTHRENNKMRYEPRVNFSNTKSSWWNRDENSTKNDENSIERRYRSAYVKNPHEESDRDAEIRKDSVENSENDSIVPCQLRLESNFERSLREKCNSTVCVPICCERDYRIDDDKCEPYPGDYPFPRVSGTNKTVDEVFQLIVSDPCQKTGHYLVDYDFRTDNKYTILPNGSIYSFEPGRNCSGNPTAYCFSIVKKKYKLLRCFQNESNAVYEEFIYSSIGHIVSLPFLLSTFFVYTVLPELRNLHGFILRGYVGSLFVVNLMFPVLYLSRRIISESVCVTMAFVMYFSFTTSFFWLNVMCIDIWWTFGDLRSLQENTTSRKNKKFIIYSIYAWVCPFILTIVCAVMENASNVPDNFIRPDIDERRCWFATDEAKTLYFYAPMSITFICNVCLFICTTLKFVQHTRNAASQLSDSIHQFNKQSYNLYLKLFILMGGMAGISWTMEIISWLSYSVPLFVQYFIDIVNALEGFFVFFFFVWKDKIKKQLIKRLSWQK